MLGDEVVLDVDKFAILDFDISIASTGFNSAGFMLLSNALYTFIGCVKERYGLG